MHSTRDPQKIQAIVSPDRVIRIPAPHAAGLCLSRFARVLIVGIVALGLWYVEHPVLALSLLAFWGIVGSYTRRYEDTTDRIYTVHGPFGIVWRLHGDEAFDRWYDAKP